MKTTKLIYVFDALCSWCYAIDKEIKIIRDKNIDQIELQMVSGGMFVSDNPKRALDVMPVKNVRPGYQRVMDIGKVEITDNYLEKLIIEENYVLDSEITARGFSAYKMLEEDRQKDLDFVYGMQKNMYINGLNPNKEEYYIQIAQQFNIDPASFLKEMDSDRVKASVEEDFTYAGKLGVNSFPQVFLIFKDEYYLVTKGYQTAELMQKTIDSIMGQ